MADTEILTITELCVYLKLPKQTVYKLCQHNGLPCFKAGKQLRFRKDGIDKWIDREEKRNARWIKGRLNRGIR